MLLTHDELIVLVREGVIQNCDTSQVNAASIDITLGNSIWYENLDSNRDVVDLANKITPSMSYWDITDNVFDIEPGGFVLASSREVFSLPNNIAAEYKLKSSLARSGLDHLNAGWADPGWHGSVLTLELNNVLQRHTLRLRPGMKIGQMVFFRGETVPDHASYAVRVSYNGDTPNEEPGWNNPLQSLRGL